jgi:uncharacterized coiled-coil protein SlyX
MNWRELRDRLSKITTDSKYRFKRGLSVAKVLKEYLSEPNDFCKINDRLRELESKDCVINDRVTDGHKSTLSTLASFRAEIELLKNRIDLLTERLQEESSIWYADDYEIVSSQCTDCDERMRYSDYYDSFYCHKCDRWKNPGCGHKYPECMSNCETRPEKPSQVKHRKVGYKGE